MGVGASGNGERQGRKKIFGREDWTDDDPDDDDIFYDSTDSEISELRVIKRRHPLQVNRDLDREGSLLPTAKPRASKSRVEEDEEKEDEEEKFDKKKSVKFGSAGFGASRSKSRGERLSGELVHIGGLGDEKLKSQSTWGKVDEVGSLGSLARLESEANGAGGLGQQSVLSRPSGLGQSGPYSQSTVNRSGLVRPSRSTHKSGLGHRSASDQPGGLGQSSSLGQHGSLVPAVNSSSNRIGRSGLLRLSKSTKQGTSDDIVGGPGSPGRQSGCGSLGQRDSQRPSISPSHQTPANHDRVSEHYITPHPPDSPDHQSDLVHSGSPSSERHSSSPGGLGQASSSGHNRGLGRRSGSRPFSGIKLPSRSRSRSRSKSGSKSGLIPVPRVFHTQKTTSAKSSVTVRAFVADRFSRSEDLGNRRNSGQSGSGLNGTNGSHGATGLNGTKSAQGTGNLGSNDPHRLSSGINETSSPTKSSGLVRPYNEEEEEEEEIDEEGNVIKKPSPTKVGFQEALVYTCCIPKDTGNPFRDANAKASGNKSLGGKGKEGGSKKRKSGDNDKGKGNICCVRKVTSSDKKKSKGSKTESSKKTCSADDAGKGSKRKSKSKKKPKKKDKSGKLKDKGSKTSRGSKELRKGKTARGKDLNTATSKQEYPEKPPPAPPLNFLEPIQEASEASSRKEMNPDSPSASTFRFRREPAEKDSDLMIDEFGTSDVGSKYLDAIKKGVKFRGRRQYPDNEQSPKEGRPMSPNRIKHDEYNRFRGLEVGDKNGPPRRSASSSATYGTDRTRSGYVNDGTNSGEIAGGYGASRNGFLQDGRTVNRQDSRNVFGQDRTWNGQENRFGHDRDGYGQERHQEERCTCAQCLCKGNREIVAASRAAALAQNREAQGTKGDHLGTRGDALVNRGDSLGNRVDPLGNRVDGLGNRDSGYNRADHFGNRMDPSGNRVDHLENRVDPLGNRMDPLGNRVDPIGNRDSFNRPSRDRFPYSSASWVNGDNKSVFGFNNKDPSRMQKYGAYDDASETEFNDMATKLCKCLYDQSNRRCHCKCTCDDYDQQQDYYNGDGDDGYNYCSATCDNLELAYQQAGKYPELVDELEESICQRNKERFQRSMKRFEMLCKYGNLDGKTINFDDEEEYTYPRPSRGRSPTHSCGRQRCCSCSGDRSNNKAKMECAAKRTNYKVTPTKCTGFVEKVVRCIDPNTDNNGQKYGNGGGTKFCNTKWVLDKKTGEWYKVQDRNYDFENTFPPLPDIPQQRSCSPRRYSQQHHTKHSGCSCGYCRGGR